MMYFSFKLNTEIFPAATVELGNRKYLSSTIIQGEKSITEAQLHSQEVSDATVAAYALNPKVECKEFSVQVVASHSRKMTKWGRSGYNIKGLQHFTNKSLN